MKPFLRLLACTIFVIALAGGLVFHLGGKQIEYSAEVRIQGTVEKVMNHLTDPELVKLWIEEVVDIETTRNPDGEFDDKATVTLLDDGEKIELDDQFLSATDHSISVRTSCDDFDAVSIWQVIPGDGDVLVRQLMMASHKGLPRLSAMFTRSDDEQELQSDLGRLKSLIETGKIDIDLK